MLDEVRPLPCGTLSERLCQELVVHWDHRGAVRHWTSERLGTRGRYATFPSEAELPRRTTNLVVVLPHLGDDAATNAERQLATLVMASGAGIASVAVLKDPLGPDVLLPLVLGHSVQPGTVEVEGEHGNYRCVVWELTLRRNVWAGQLAARD